MINQQRLLKTFTDLVQISSPTGEEQKAAEFVSKLLRDADFTVSVDNFYNVTGHNNKENNPLLLNAHLDTVSPCRGVVPVIDNGVIRSKGETVLGADNKAAVASIIEAVTSFSPERRVEVVFTTQEESANIGALNLDYSKIKSKKGFCFDCGEPLGSIIVKSPYYSSFTISILGKSAHAAFPEKGVNSIVACAEIIKSIETGKVSKNTTVNIGTITGGSSINTVPESTLLQGEVRSYLKEEIEEEEKKLRELISTNDDVIVNTCLLRENSGYIHNQDSSDMRQIVKILEKNKLTARHRESWACSDANILNDKGIIVYNLGEGAVDIHSNKESIAVNDLYSLANLITSIIKDFRS